MNIPDNLLYTQTHEWIRVEGTRCTIGVTDYAQEQLGDIIDYDAPDVDDEVSKGEELGALETDKAAAEIYAPVSGTIISVNEDIEDQPEVVNNDPYGSGWLVVLEISDENELSDLISAEAYTKIIEEH